MSIQQISPHAQPNYQQRPPWVDELFRRLDKFETKLNKIDQTDSLVTKLNTKVNKLEQCAKMFDGKLDQVEKSTQLISDEFDSWKNSLSEFKRDVDKLTKQLNSNKISMNSIEEKKVIATKCSTHYNRLTDYGFCKAFDTVSRSLLVHKLEHYGIRGNGNRWIASFLYHRTQAVVVDGESSSHIGVESGFKMLRASGRKRAAPKGRADNIAPAAKRTVLRPKIGGDAGVRSRSTESPVATTSLSSEVVSMAPVITTDTSTESITQ
ncbi:unnamed protein product [Mytilus coruscus]|uniref:Uncharacterized protein n=1 Tax=Mytilus coruscus TaxID=42192 RepID=A0A6J8A9C7_MYTCO|nr:unnamed protein product [Mytilus coruscus]